jgi:hypothetical protein
MNVFEFTWNFTIKKMNELFSEIFITFSFLFNHHNVCVCVCVCVITMMWAQ